MKLIFKEFSVIDYNRYYFPYCVYCIKEQEDTYNDIYSKGFLPYTNDLISKMKFIISHEVLKSI